MNNSVKRIFLIGVIVFLSNIGGTVNAATSCKKLMLGLHRSGAVFFNFPAKESDLNKSSVQIDLSADLLSNDVLQIFDPEVNTEENEPSQIETENSARTVEFFDHKSKTLKKISEFEAQLEANKWTEMETSSQ